MLTVSVPSADPDENWKMSEEDKKEIEKSLNSVTTWASNLSACDGHYDMFDGTYVPDKTTKNDPVNHPGHYTYGKIECIDYITDKDFDFCLGNAVKYITRAGHKLNAIEDLKKAKWYIEREIEVLEHGQ